MSYCMRFIAISIQHSDGSRGRQIHNMMTVPFLVPFHKYWLHHHFSVNPKTMRIASLLVKKWNLLYMYYASQPRPYSWYFLKLAWRQRSFSSLFDKGDGDGKYFFLEVDFLELLVFSSKHWWQVESNLIQIMKFLSEQANTIALK